MAGQGPSMIQDQEAKEEPALTTGQQCLVAYHVLALDQDPASQIDPQRWRLATGLPPALTQSDLLAHDGSIFGYDARVAAHVKDFGLVARSDVQAFEIGR